MQSRTAIFIQTESRRPVVDIADPQLRLHEDPRQVIVAELVQTLAGEQVPVVVALEVVVVGAARSVLAVPGHEPAAHVESVALGVATPGRVAAAALGGGEIFEADLCARYSNAAHSHSIPVVLEQNELARISPEPTDPLDVRRQPVEIVRIHVLEVAK